MADPHGFATFLQIIGGGAVCLGIAGMIASFWIPK